MSSDTRSTIIGIVLATITAVGDYFAHLGPDGVDYSQPTFWIALVVAALMGAKGYFHNKQKPAEAKPAEAPPIQAPPNA